MSYLFWIIIAAILVVGAYIYISVVRHQLGIAATLMDKSTIVANAQGFFGKLEANLVNWKTVVLAWVGGLVQLVNVLPADVLSTWQSLPWAQVFDAKVANWITIACALLIPIVHAQGVVKAAATPPVDPGA